MALFDRDRNPFGHRLKASLGESRALSFTVYAIGAVHWTHIHLADAASKDSTLRFRMRAYQLLRQEVSISPFEDSTFVVILLLAITEICKPAHTHRYTQSGLCRVPYRDQVLLSSINFIVWKESNTIC